MQVITQVIVIEDEEVIYGWIQRSENPHRNSTSRGVGETRGTFRSALSSGVGTLFIFRMGGGSRDISSLAVLSDSVA